MAAYVGCIAGASMKDDYLSKLRTAGFDDICIERESNVPVSFSSADPIGAELIDQTKLPLDELSRLTADTVVSINLSATKAIETT